MSKELEALERIHNRLLKETDTEFGSHVTEGRIQDKVDLDTIETKLKKQDEILRIIKEKRVNVLELSTCANYETFIAFFNMWNWYGEYDRFILTQTEFDLLKEWLE